MIYYLDSSLLVKRFVQEDGSVAVRRLLRASHVATSSLARVEIRSAIARLVRSHALASKDGARALSQVDRTLDEVTIVEARGRTLDLAGELVGRRPLRAYDAVHLASALRLARESGSALTFGCADAILTKSAADEGLRILAL